MDTREQAAQARTGTRAALWVSALVLLGLVVAQGLLNLRSPLAGEAEGALVSTVGPLTVLTAEGTNEDLLLVLDNRSEQLFVYRTDPRTGVQLHQRLSVPQLFTEARARSLGHN